MIVAKPYWPVKTFASETKKNYNIAINYYTQKQQAFISAAQQQVNQSLMDTMHNIPSIQQLLDKQLTVFNNQTIAPWQKLQGMKNKQIQLTSALQKWNQGVTNLNKELSSRSGIANLLNSLTGSKDFANFDEASSLSMIEVSRWINKSLQGGVSNQAIAGDRAAAFGEIFESLFADSFASGTNEIIQTLKVGLERTTRNPNSGNLTQGKSDIIFNAGSTLQLDTNMTGLTVGKTQGGAEILLDANEWVDLEKNNKFFSKYTSGPYSSIAGASVKQWDESIIGTKTGSSSRATMGNSSFTARLIDIRWSPKGAKTISWVFDNQQSFTSYTGYIVSKYLINVIGALNIFMVSGSGATTTAQWLRSLMKRKYVISHSFGQGIVSGAEKNAFIVKPGLVVAYKGDY